MLTGKDLKKLKSKLPKDYRAILKERTGVSESSVYQVLRGDFNNNAVIKEAIKLAQEQSNKNNDFSSQINAL